MDVVMATTIGQRGRVWTHKLFDVIIYPSTSSWCDGEDVVQQVSNIVNGIANTLTLLTWKSSKETNNFTVARLQSWLFVDLDVYSGLRENRPGINRLRIRNRTRLTAPCLAIVQAPTKEL